LWVSRQGAQRNIGLFLQKKTFWPFGAWRCTPLPSESMATVCQHGARSGCFNGASLDPIGESTWQIIDDQLHSIGELV